MRVIAGQARHLSLKTVAGNNTRPTSDKIKETLFNILQNECHDIRFMDLFAGSGGIGIEALSRGASYAVFIDNDRGCCKCIHENLATTKFEDQASVLCRDVKPALRSLEGQKPFHIIFMDPPYKKDIEKEVLDYLKDSSLVDEDTLIIVEAALRTDVSYLEEMGYVIKRRKEYKTNMHLFLTKDSGK